MVDKVNKVHKVNKVQMVHQLPRALITLPKPVCAAFLLQ